MTDDSMTGPWALALGTLAVGVAAITAELLRRRNEESEAGNEQLRDDVDDEWAVDRGPERR